jgi:hypothetical protein
MISMDDKYYMLSVNGEKKAFLGVVLDGNLFIRVYNYRCKYLAVFEFIKLYENSDASH